MSDADTLLCRACGQSLPLSAFPARHTTCRTCRASHARERYHTDPDYRQAVRDRNRDYRFGTGATDFYLVHRLVNGTACDICRRTEDEVGGPLHFDHFPLAHEREQGGKRDRVKYAWQWRGVLCRDCNTSLITHGRSSIVWIGSAALRSAVRQYLHRWRERIRDHYRHHPQGDPITPE